MMAEANYGKEEDLSVIWQFRKIKTRAKFQSFRFSLGFRPDGYTLC